jgi:hypothetical protein
MRYLIGRGRGSLGSILDIDRRYQPTGAAHSCPVIFVDSSTNKAYLIIVAMNPAMRPGEPVGAQSFEEPLEEWRRHAVLILKFCEIALHTGGQPEILKDRRLLGRYGPQRTTEGLRQAHTRVHWALADGQSLVSLPASNRRGGKGSSSLDARHRRGF